ncbi:hypothetical protein GH733_012751 [Mirounga leonina]|nr:hypothetical protein GH733_012751 [Mirounga leonina]
MANTAPAKQGECRHIGVEGVLWGDKAPLSCNELSQAELINGLIWVSEVGGEVLGPCPVSTRSQPPFPHLQDMVYPTMFFDIAMEGKPLDCVSFELFAKFQRQQKTFMLQALGRKDLVIMVPAFIIILGFMCQGGDFTGHNGTGGNSIYEEKFDNKNFI